MASYAQVKVSVRPEIAEAFKAACGKAGMSMASEITRFMLAYPSAVTKSATVKIGTRSERRKTVQMITAILKAIHAAEERYRDNIPENLQTGQAYENAGNAIERLDEAILALEEAF
jgi:antitoxin component of RelBE/YafQ-DinJ toxin-antitoxin module